MQCASTMMFTRTTLLMSKFLIPLLACLILATTSTAQTSPIPAATGLSYAIPPPTPNGGKEWETAFLRAGKLVDELTLQEKVSLVTGQDASGSCAGQNGNITRLGIPMMCYQDSPAGPRLGHTQWPSGVTTAATWDTDLIYARSYAMGQDFYNLGVHVAMGMVTGGPLGRSPKGGRNWEGWFTDPYATGIASWHGVRGLRDTGVQTLSKHWIAYEQETFRNPYNFTEPYSIYNASEQVPISSNLDDKTTHELYMWSFAESVRAGVTHIMCAYNVVNGTHSCANSESNNRLLKTELNFQGALISDWGATWGTQAFVEGGLDINMPGLGFGDILGPFYDQELVQMVQNGTVSESRLNDMVSRVLTPWIATGQMDKPLPPTVMDAGGPNRIRPDPVYIDGQYLSVTELARKISADGTIMLKNTGSLPLKSPRNIAVIGQDAGPSPLGIQGCGELFRNCDILQNNGTLSLGGGSGYVWANNLITPLQAIQSKALETDTLVQWVIDNNASSIILETLTGTNGLPISEPDVCLVFAERYQRENMDRNDLNLNIANWTRSEDIILETAANCNNTIVVLHVGGPVIMEAWIDNPNVTAVLAPLFPGEQTGPGLVDVLWGHISPSAKLPFTVGKKETDYPPHTISDPHTVTPQSNFTEKLKIDYRWFDTYNITPRFEFGFGLSYSTFEYSNIKIDLGTYPDTYAVQETNEQFVGQITGQSIYDVIATVSAKITNTGDWIASEVAQLYVEFPAVEEEPPKVLRGFQKLKNLHPHASQTSSFPIRRKDIMVWDVTLQKWRLPQGGDITFYVGASSRNLPLTLEHTF